MFLIQSPHDKTMKNTMIQSNSVAHGTEELLTISQLSLNFATDRGPVKALRDINLQLHAGEIVGLVGESGSGKSTLGMSIARLLPKTATVSAASRINLEGNNILDLSEREMRLLRGSNIAVIFQEPINTLNPTMRISAQMTEVLREHSSLTPQQARERARVLLSDMQFTDVDRVLDAYPFQLSGGMNQRVLIAMAFSGQPSVLIADEPTTALDVTVQAQVLRLLYDRAKKTNTAVLLISHDVGVVSQICDRVYVIYGGKIVEHGRVTDVIQTPKHPYTQALIRSLPTQVKPKQKLAALAGSSPDLSDPPPGCVFQQRCASAGPDCLKQPSMRAVCTHAGHYCACWRVSDPGIVQGESQ